MTLRNVDNRPVLGMPRIRHEPRPPHRWDDYKRLGLEDVTSAMGVSEDNEVNDHDRAREVIALIETLEEIGLPTSASGYTIGLIADLRAALTRQRDTADAGQRELFGDGGE